MLSGEVKRSGKTVEQVAADFVMADRSSSIIQRAASVEEVANMVVYTCSPQASATTGAALRVDGGVLNTLGTQAGIGGWPRPGCPSRRARAPSLRRFVRCG